MNITKIVTSITDNEKGNLLLLAMVILLALSLIAIMMSNTTLLETTIASNENCINLSKSNAEIASQFGLAILEIGRDRSFDKDLVENLKSLSDIFPADSYSLAGDAPDNGIYFWDEGESKKTFSEGGNGYFQDWLYDDPLNLVPNLAFPYANATFYPHTFISDTAPDVRLLLLESSAIDIDKLYTAPGPGKAIENRAGYEYKGKSLAGDFAALYRVDTVGFSCNAHARTIISMIVKEKM